MVKVAVIGNGETANNHFYIWSQIQHVDVVSVLPVNEKAGEQLPEIFKNETAENTEDLNVDIIDLCVPMEQRSEFIQQHHKEGVSIICESPLVSNLTEASAILKACEEKNIHLYIGNTKRFSPEYVNARNQVHSGNIGKTGVIRLSSTSSSQSDEMDIFSYLGVPEFDWLTWTFGNVERVMAKHVQKVRKDGTPVEYALVSLRMIDQSFAHVELFLANHEETTSFEITGDKGMLTHDSRESIPINLEISGKKVEMKESILAKTALQRQLEAIASSVKDQCKWTGATSDILHSIQIAEAARASVKIGQPVLLKGVD